jgi:hypothetical protein
MAFFNDSMLKNDESNHLCQLAAIFLGQLLKLAVSMYDNENNIPL